MNIIIIIIIFRKIYENSYLNINQLLILYKLWELKYAVENCDFVIDK